MTDSDEKPRSDLLDSRGKFKKGNKSPSQFTHDSILALHQQKKEEHAEAFLEGMLEEARISFPSVRNGTVEVWKILGAKAFQLIMDGEDQGKVSRLLLAVRKMGDLDTAQQQQQEGGASWKDFLATALQDSTVKISIEHDPNNPIKISPSDVIDVTPIESDAESEEEDE